MAINNPRGNYKHLLQINNIDVALVQMITAPPVEWTEHRHGSAGNSPDKKTPGKLMIGDLVVEMVIPDDGDPGIWNAFYQAESELRTVYAGMGVLSELGPGNPGAPIQNFALGEIWIKKIETANYETTEANSDNLKRTVTFSVESYRPI